MYCSVQNMAQRACAWMVAGCTPSRHYRTLKQDTCVNELILRKISHKTISNLLNGADMEPIITYKERCRRCYSCVRTCPVKAIKVDQGFAQIMYDRCIGCGNCLNCPQNAKVVVNRMVRTLELLASGSPVVAVLGCSFPAFFQSVTPGQLGASLKSLGFLEVHEGAYGARMIAGSCRSEE